GALHGGVDRDLGNQRMRAASGAALGRIGLESRRGSGPMGQGVDVLALGAHALRGVDREGAAESQKEPPGPLVREALPIDLDRLAARISENKAGGRLADHLDDIAVASDRRALAIDLSYGLAIHPQPVAGGYGQVKEFRLVAAIDDGLVGRLVRPDLTAGLEALADRPADVG